MSIYDDGTPWLRAGTLELRLEVTEDDPVPGYNVVADAITGVMLVSRHAPIRALLEALEAAASPPRAAQGRLYPRDARDTGLL